MSALPEWIWINGEFLPGDQHSLSPFDRGLMYADGLYETLLGTEGRPRHFALHWSRMQASAKALEIPLTVEGKAIHDILCELLERCGLTRTRARLKVVLTRGVNTLAPWVLETDRPTLMATAWEAPPPRTEPLACGVLPWRRDAAEGIWNHKTLCLLSRGLARATMIREGFDDAFVLNTDGHVCEATTSNVFALIEERVVTPPLSDGLLPGTERTRLIEGMAASGGMPVVEESLTLDQLHSAEAVWLTNAIALAVPVGRIGGWVIEWTEAGWRAMSEAMGMLEG